MGEEGLAEADQSCGTGDLLRYKGDADNRRRPVNLVHNSDGFQVGNNFYLVVCWVAPTECAVGLVAVELSDICRHPQKGAGRCESGQMVIHVGETGYSLRCLKSGNQLAWRIESAFDILVGLRL